MALTHYKARGYGQTPICCLCGGPGDGPRARVELTHGVAVWLCPGHRSPEFMTARAGRDFAATLGAVWSAAGCLSARRSAALAAHLRRVRGPRPRDRPGSYAWPELRREAEARFARGEGLQAVVAALRARTPSDWARQPSARTVRRWRQEARWLTRARPGGGLVKRRSPSGRPPALISPATANPGPRAGRRRARGPTGGAR